MAGYWLRPNRNGAFIIDLNVSIALSSITISNSVFSLKGSIEHCAMRSTLVYVFAQRFAILHLVNLLLQLDYLERILGI